MLPVQLTALPQFTRSSHSNTKLTDHSLLCRTTEQPSQGHAHRARDGASTKKSSDFEAVLCPWRDAFFRLQRPADGGCVCLRAWSFVVPGTHAGSGCGSRRKRDAWCSQRATATDSVAVGSLRGPLGNESNEPFRWRSSSVEYEGLERFRPRGVLSLVVVLLRCFAANLSQPVELCSRCVVWYSRLDLSFRRAPRPGNNRQYLSLYCKEMCQYKSQYVAEHCTLRTLRREKRTDAGHTTYCCRAYLGLLILQPVAVDWG